MSSIDLQRGIQMAKSGYIAVDLDGTLAHYNGWKGDKHIGQPIPKMADRVRQWLEEGKIVKIFTARASEYKPEDRAEVVKIIQAWTTKHFGVALEVTNEKDYAMLELWDDRAKQVVPNHGDSMEELYLRATEREAFFFSRMLQLEGALRGLGKEGEQILNDLKAK
jgi:hypothetical protein